MQPVFVFRSKIMYSYYGCSPISNFAACFKFKCREASSPTGVQSTCRHSPTCSEFQCSRLPDKCSVSMWNESATTCQACTSSKSICKSRTSPLTNFNSTARADSEFIRQFLTEATPRVWKASESRRKSQKAAAASTSTKTVCTVEVFSVPFVPI